MANRYTNRRYNPFSKRGLSSASNHLRISISSIYDESTTGVNVRTGRPSVSKIASRTNAENDKNIGLMSVSGNLHALYGINQI